MGQLFVWWLLVELLGFVGLPLAAVVFANLPDCGWTLAKPLSLLVVGWLVWFPLAIVNALPFSPGWIVGTMLAFALVNMCLFRMPGVRERLRALWEGARGYVLGAEALFALAFAGMAWERSFTPGVVDTEKFMDVAFLSAIWRAPHLPPPDPWLSGQPINYYYFGHYLLALVAKVLGTQPAVAFNLGIALIFALTAVAVFGVAANLFAAARRTGARQAPLSGAWVAGVAAVAFVLIFGNLDSIGWWWQAATAAASGAHAALSNPLAWWWHRELWPTYNWWCPSRAFSTSPDCSNYTAITEFPAFSFALADLHAHVLALPFATLAVAIALNLLLARGAGLRAFGIFEVGQQLRPREAQGQAGLPRVSGASERLSGLPQPAGTPAVHAEVSPASPASIGDEGNRRTRLWGLAWLDVVRESSLGWLTLLVSAVALGALYAINGWDLPTYLGLALLALAIQQWLAHERRLDEVVVRDFVLAGGALVALAVIAYLPFYRGFVSPSQGVGLVPASARSPIVDEVYVFGIPAFVVLSYLLLRLARWLDAAVVAVCITGLVLLTRLSAGFGGWTLLWGLAVIAVCVALTVKIAPVWPAAAKPACAGSEETLAFSGSGSDETAASAGAGENLAGSEAPAANADRGDAPHLRDRAEVFFYCLVGTAAALVVACELFYLRDVFAGGSLLRMNTVFKLFYQAWLLCGVAAGVGVVWLVARAVQALRSHLEPLRMRSSGWAAREWVVSRAGAPGVGDRPTPPTPLPYGGRGEAGAAPGRSRAGEEEPGPLLPRKEEMQPAIPLSAAEEMGQGMMTPRLTVLRWLGAGGIVLWMAALAALLAGALIYPVLAMAARTENFTLPRSLDGTAYMASDPVNAGDGPAIAWLNAHVTGDPVIAEAASYDEYTHLGRVSAFTGLPTLLGWGGHEVQWRVNWLAEPGHANVINERLAAVSAIYTSADPQTVLRVMRQYGVQLVYAGAAERAQYAGVDLVRFGHFLRVVYAGDGVTIYALPSFKGIS